MTVTARKSLYLLSLLLVFLPTAQASEVSCNDLLRGIAQDNSLKAVIERTSLRLERALKEEPLPNSSNISARRLQVWTGEQGPKAFDSFLAEGVRFVRTPDANSEHPMMAMRKHPGNSSLLHVEMPFNGERTSTKAYVSRPIFETNGGTPDGEYLIGPEHKAVVWHIHGGGTPSAVAANASSKAQVFLKKGIPLIAVDQPGHGNGPTIAFTSDEEIFDWNYQLMQKMIHPDVEIHLQGHSWGGMFTTRMWQLSHTDKYKQIVSYQAESPGADMTLGVGTSRDKALLDKQINDSIDDWEDRAAASDVEFLKNTIENRKMSPVAQEYTFLTDVFYRWNHLTEAEIAERKRLNVLVGTYDGLVYVGRENIYDEYFSRIAGDNYHKFSKGTTFRGNDIEQGHQIFDLVDETGDFVAYRIGTDLIEEVSGGDFVKQADQLQKDAVSIVNKLFNHYANNFAFREFLSQHTEYVEVFNGRHGKLLKESQQLKNYVSSIEKLKKEHQQTLSAKLNDNVAKWSAQFNVRGGIRKAKAELEVDMSPERKQTLKDYIDKVKESEASAKETFVDEVYLGELDHFAKKYGDEAKGNVAQRVKELEGIQNSQKSLMNLNKKLQKAKDDPSRVAVLEKEMNAVYQNLGIEEDKRSVEGIEALAEELKTPPSHITGGPEKVWRKDFERAHQEYKVIVKGHKRRFGDAMIEASRTVHAPSGIFGKTDAEWELSINLTSERKAQLEDYISQYDGFIDDIKQKLDADLAKKIAAVKPVEGLDSLDEISERLNQITKLLNKRYLPKEDHEKYAELKTIVDNLNTLDKELYSKQGESYAAKLQAVEKKLYKLKNTRSKKIGTLHALLERAGTSPALEKSLEVYQRDLDNLIAVNMRYAEKQEHFYLELLENDALTKENILNIPEDLKAMAKEYEDALAVADISAADLKAIKFAEAAKGNLTSEADPDGTKLKEVIEALLGDFKVVDGKVELSESGIEREIYDLSNEQADIETALYKVRLKIIELEHEYLRILTEEEIEQSSVSIHAVNMTNLLEQDLEQLLSNLGTQEGKIKVAALKKTLLLWEDLWSKVNADDNFRETDTYTISQ